MRSFGRLRPWIFASRYRDKIVPRETIFQRGWFDGRVLFRVCFSRAFLGERDQGGGELFVEGEKVFDPLAVVVERLRAVAAVTARSSRRGPSPGRAAWRAGHTGRPAWRRGIACARPAPLAPLLRRPRVVSRSALPATESCCRPVYLNSGNPILVVHIPAAPKPCASPKRERRNGSRGVGHKVNEIACNNRFRHETHGNVMAILRRNRRDQQISRFGWRISTKKRGVLAYSRVVSACSFAVIANSRLGP